MARFELTHQTVASMAAQLFPSAPLLELVPLRGGLEASVARLTIREATTNRSRSLVVKRVSSGGSREVALYRSLADAGVTPELLGAVDCDDSTWLFLERVRPASSWPWRESANTRLVIEQLARIHRFSAPRPDAGEWNYESELLGSAQETFDFASAVATSLPEIDVRRELRPLVRVVAAIGSARERIMKPTLGTTLIHGDVHTGNVMLRKGGGRAEVIFLDCGRSRTGSPLEDISSWLLSLRSWEPAAARDHDTLFRAYLSAAGLAPTLSQELRDAYWIAAASNVLAGALRYQLVSARESSGRKRAAALAQARAAFRIIRRADERLPRA